MGVRKRPYAFTEQGVAMLAGVLNSDAAVRANIVIMRAFVRMRSYLATTPETLAARLESIDRRLMELEQTRIAGELGWHTKWSFLLTGIPCCMSIQSKVAPTVRTR